MGEKPLLMERDKEEIEDEICNDEEQSSEESSDIENMEDMDPACGHWGTATGASGYARSGTLTASTGAFQMHWLCRRCMQDRPLPLQQLVAVLEEQEEAMQAWWVQEERWQEEDLACQERVQVEDIAQEEEFWTDLLALEWSGSMSYGIKIGS
ncbi:hypothetical protein Y1Q_0007335 [Alligator mississippiensis]|uniref:Uncharacterized protein n=1 Tax=Alligator mississippiensis TaxID=8496 RepID=A0A151P7M8_ALLMI|nr:hypothetical protein Y1Q_0007335 [Alligator mississippiensis]